VSLKSRLRFLAAGYPYTFGALELERDDGRQHVAALTFDQLRYVAVRAGLAVTRFDVDLLQAGSLALLPLWPLIWLGAAWRGIARSDHNCLRLLCGRILFLELRRTA
jgi:hypothetical protein